MALIKLNRINKGGEILVNSDHILFIEIDSKTTTLRMTDNLLFSVQETVDQVAQQIERLHTDRIKNALQESGVGK